MKYINKAVLAGAVLSLHVPLHAQEDGAVSLEEIIVTGRNREESLKDVPVSASVLSDTLIQEAGISDLYDLFEMVPGLHYDEQGDRLASQPSIRGIQANDVASNRVKVSAFIDGMPVLGSQGSIGLGFQQVEIYRGPQSAAFGRSTFAGAINYITKDPTEQFEGSVGVNVSDYGTRILDGTISGPITDTIGYIIGVTHEDSSSPDEYSATGNAAQNLDNGTNIGQSDGTQYGAKTGDNISAKFVFEPSDNFRAAVTFAHVETHDQSNPEFYLTEQARNDCFEGNGIRAATGMTSIWLEGTMDCDWSSFRENYANHDDEAYLLANQPLLDQLVSDAVAAGAEATDVNGQNLSVEQQILMVARAYSIPEDDRGAKSERDRFSLQTENLFDDGSALEFSLMHSEEEQNRLSDVSVYYYDPDNVGVFDDGVTNDMAAGVSITWEDADDPMGGIDGTGGDDTWDYNAGMGSPRAIEASPAEIEENYAEVRWVSPGTDRLRYVVGASYYDYSFIEQRYGAGMDVEAVSYGALLNGIVPEFEQLTGLDFAPDDAILSEDATNTAAFFNVNYDLTDRVTLSAEGRYQSDEVGGRNNDTGLSAEVTTKSFLPRFAISYNLNEDTTYYLQWSKGVNPAGINVGLLDEGVIATLNSGVDNALVEYDASLIADVLDNDTGLPIVGGDGFIDIYNTTTDEYTGLAGDNYKVGFDAETFQSYREEELVNIEFGFKGTLFDDKLSYAGAIYMIDWKDQLQNGGIQWASPCANSANAGDPDAGPCEYEGVEYFYVADVDDTSAGGVGLNFGDVKIKGLELEGTYRFSDNWDVRGSASYLEAEYDSYCDITLAELDLQANAGYVDALNINVLEPGPDSLITDTCYVVDGNEVVNQPSLTASLSPSYSTDIAGMRFGARLDIRYEDERALQSGNYSYYEAVTSTNLSFSLSGDAWTATLYVNNLTDETSPRQIGSGGDDTDIFGLIDTDLSAAGSTDFLGDNYALERDNFRFSPRIPRTLGLRFNYSF